MSTAISEKNVIEEGNTSKSVFSLMNIAAVLFLCVFPLICTSYLHITEFKRTLMYVLTSVMAVLWCVSKIKGSSRIVWNRRVVIGCLYFGCILLSAMFGSYRTLQNEEGQLVVLFGSFRGDSLLVTFCYFLIYCCFLSSAVTIENIVPFFGYAVLLHFSVVLLQLCGVNIFQLFPEPLSVRTDYIFQGTLGNIDFTAGYLSLILPLLFTPYIFNKGRLQLFSLLCGLAGEMTVLISRVDTGRIVLYIILGGLVALALMMPKKSGRILTLLAGMLIMFAIDSLVELPWYSDTKQYEFGLLSPEKTAVYIVLAIVCVFLAKMCQSGHTLNPCKSRLLIYGFIVGIILSVFVIRVIPFTKKHYVFWQMHEILNGRGKDSFGKYRWGVWRYAIQMAKKNLLFGTGPDTFHQAFSDFVQQVGETVKYYQEFDFAHNAYVHILACNGIGAMISYIVLNGMLIVHAFRTKRAFGYAMALGLLGYCAYEFFVFSIFIVSPMAWTIRGLIAGMEVPLKSDGEKC